MQLTNSGCIIGLPLTCLRREWGSKMSNQRMLVAAFSCIAIAAMIFFGVFYYKEVLFSRNQNDRLIGLWLPDTETGVNAENKFEVFPEPFCFLGDTVVVHFLKDRVGLEEDSSLYLRLQVVRKGDDFYYRSHFKSHNGTDVFVPFASLENDVFVTFVEGGSKWKMNRKNKEEVRPEFLGYFRVIPPHNYEAPTIEGFGRRILEKK